MQFFRYKHTNNLIFWYLKLKNENVLWWADTTRPLEGGEETREREGGKKSSIVYDGPIQRPGSIEREKNHHINKRHKKTDLRNAYWTFVYI